MMFFQKIHAVLTNEESREKLRLYTERFPVKAVLLPIKSVGVQVGIINREFALVYCSLLLLRL